MKCVVVDDEKLGRELLEDNIRRIPFLEPFPACKNALEAATLIHSHPIDLMFLDIQMPGLDGLDFLRTIPNPPLVVVVSAYEKYAIAGFDLKVVDYLVKPVPFERFLTACNRVYELFNLRQGGEARKTSPGEGFFFVSVEYGAVKVAIEDILFVEGMKDYIKIHLASAPKPVITRMSIKAIGEKVSSHSFIRIHKSFLVSTKRITSVKRDIVYVGDKELPVGDSYKENVYRALKNTTA